MQDPCVNFLVEQGSTGLVQTERNLRAFFRGTAHDADLKRTVRHYLRGLRDVSPECPVGRARWRILPDRDWHEGWRKHFRPQRVGKRFLVTPPWIPSTNAGRLVISIEPAMAFGTGTHETTRCCLEFIDEVCAAGLPSAALDVGTGSGILAIALAKLGVPEVLAIDNDPIALEAARANVRLNEVGATVTLSDAQLGRVRRRFPLVAANLILDTLVQLALPLSRSVRSRGALILSGLLGTQAETVLPHFEGFALERRKDRRDWTTLLLRRLS